MSNNYNLDVPDFLSRLGIKNIRVMGDEVQYSCPFAGHAHGDRNPSATMNVNTTQFKCFGCGEYGNAVNFLAQVEGIPPHEALMHIEDEYGMGFQDPQGELVKELDEILSDKTVVPDDPRPPSKDVLKEYDVDWFHVDQLLAQGKLPEEDPGTYILDRGFSAVALMKWRIGYDEKSNRLTIPWYDEHGELVGFKGRAWHPEQQPRYKVLGGEGYDYDTFHVADHLFGLQRCRHAKELIVVEGELNAIAMDASRHANTVAFSGRWISEKQARLIKQYADSVVFISDDTEDAIRNARMLHHSMPVKIVPKREKDPADMTHEERRWILQKAISSLSVR